MFWIILIALCLAWFLGAYFMDNRENFSKDYEASMEISLIVGGIVLLAAIITTTSFVSFQKYDIENVKALDKEIVIYQERADSLTKKFIEILGKEYPNHELKIFEGMTPENIDVFLTKYPEIKASITSMSLVDRIEDLNNVCYQLRDTRIQTIRNINYRGKSPWTITWFVPDPPLGYVN